MNFALMQLFNIIGQFKKAVIFSYSATARQSLAKADSPLSKRVTEINLHITQKKDLQKGIKFQWVPSYSRDVGNEMSDYLAKSTKSATLLPHKPSFHSTKLRIKRKI